MGCASSRSNISCEEAALVNGDSRLYYFGHDISTLTKSFNSISNDSKVTLSSLESLSKTLPLIYEEDPEVISFYKKLSKRSKIPLKHLTALAVLLAKGSIFSKISALAETWGNGNDISKDQFSEMLDYMFELSLDKLSLLRSHPSSENHYTEESMDRFLSIAREGKDRSKERILKELFVDDTISKANVINWANIDNNQNWFNAKSVRPLLKKSGKRSLKKKRVLRTEENTLNE